MLKPIKKPFIALLSFSGSIAHITKVSDYTKCLSWNSKLCIARPKVINLYYE